MMMRMNGMYSAAFALVLFVAGSGPAAAAEAPPAAETDHQIVIVNDHAAPVMVFAEDAQGHLREIVHLKPGEVQLVEAPAETTKRLHVRPTDSKDALSTWGHEGIKSESLGLKGQETVVFWVGQDLAQSVVEIRSS
jgi:hypothetical protein